MTNIQVAYQKAQEEARHNREMERQERDRISITKGQYSDQYGYNPGERPYSVSRYQTEKLFDTGRSIINGIVDNIKQTTNRYRNAVSKLFNL